MKPPFSKALSLLTLLGVSLLAACSSMTDISRSAPYNSYAGKSVRLVRPLPVEFDHRTGQPKVVVPPNTPVTIQRVFIENSLLRGPVEPGIGPSTQIFAVVQFPHPSIPTIGTLNYPLGIRKPGKPYVDEIVAAPWEPLTTPARRFVGRDGKGYKKPTPPKPAASPSPSPAASPTHR